MAYMYILKNWKEGRQLWRGMRGMASFHRQGVATVTGVPYKATEEQLQKHNEKVGATSIDQSQFNVRVVTKHIEVQSTADRTPLAEDRPLVLLFAWLYASRKVLNKHRILYHQRGYDVLTVKGDPIYAVSITGYGMNVAKDLLKFVKTEVRPEQPFLVHGVSVGLALYSMVINHVQENAEYGGILDRVVGQVFDGPISSPKGAALGVSNSIKNPVGKLLYTSGVWSYFTFVPGVLKGHDLCRTMWEKHIPTTPILLFGCRNDPMSTAEYNERCVEGWRKMGCDVRLKFWDDSAHSNHMRIHKDEYVNTLNAYLDTMEP